MVKNTVPRTSAAPSSRGRTKPNLSSMSSSVPSPPATRARINNLGKTGSTRNTSNSEASNSKTNSEASSQQDQPPDNRELGKNAKKVDHPNDFSSSSETFRDLRTKFFNSQKEYEDILKKATDNDALFKRETLVSLMENQFTVTNDVFKFCEDLIRKQNEASDASGEKLRVDFREFAAQITTSVNKLNVKLTSSLEKLSLSNNKDSSSRPSEADVIAGNFDPPMVKLPLGKSNTSRPKPKASLIEISAEAEGVNGLTVGKTFSEALKSRKLDTAIDKIIRKDDKILVMTRNSTEANKILDSLKDEKSLVLKPFLAFKPTIRVSYVDSEINDEDIPAVIFDNNEVFNKNPRISKEEFLANFHVVKVYQTKADSANGTKTVLICTSPKLRSIACAVSKLKIGIMNCGVTDHISPTRCGLCNQYGHPRRLCRNNPSCRSCLGDHETSECKKDPAVKPADPVCAACHGSGRKEINHQINDKNCPAWIEAVRVHKSKTDYGQ